jgi:hypothetical protein
MTSAIPTFLHSWPTFKPRSRFEKAVEGQEPTLGNCSVVLPFDRTHEPFGLL